MKAKWEHTGLNKVFVPISIRLQSTTDAWRRPEDTTAETCEYKQDERVGSNRKVNNAKILASEKDIYINNKINNVNFNTDYPDHIVKIYQNLNNYQILKEIYFSL